MPHATAPDLRNDHGHGAGVERHERRTRWVVGVTAAMMVLELVIGYTTGSMALVADGWHMATHAGAIGVSAGAYWFARTRAGHPAFSFGTGKVYALAGYTSAVALAFVAIWIGLESAIRLARPVTIAFTDALPVAVLGLVVNVACAYLLSDDDHDHGDHDHSDHDHGDHDHGDHDHGDHDHGDHNLRSAHLHVVADAFTSVLAIAALLGGRFLDWTFLDPAMGLVGAVVILRWAWVLCRGAARQLLDVTPSSKLEDTVRAHLEAVDDVRVLDLHVWALGPGRTGCIASIATSTPRDAAHYRDAVRRVVELAHVTIEVHRAPAEVGPGA